MDFKTLGDALLTAVFPRRCPYCGRVILPSQYVCDSCLSDLPMIEAPICSFCGHSKKDCVCKKRKSHYDAVVAPFYYEAEILTAVHRLKYENKDFLAQVFAKDMAEAVRRFLPLGEIDVLTYVPFTKKQQRERLYNPSEILCRALSKELSIPIEPLLLKLYETKTQHMLSEKARSGNVLGTYDTVDVKNIAGKTVLLVDDIKTTGATLSECAKMLLLADAEKVYACTFAVTKNQKKKS